MNKPILIIRLVLYISIGLLISSFFLKKRLPEKDQILSQLYYSPVQEKINEFSFKVEAASIKYTIVPLYRYKLYGLAVSTHDSRAWWDIYHKNWGDYLNIKDLCVIWGDNLKNNAYTRMKFSSGSWTCRVGVNPNTAKEDWENFDLNCLSNNHILAHDPADKNILKKVTRGDQIYLQGYLVTYFHNQKGGDFSRSSSTTRRDKGNGACEVIYLTHFKILKKANVIWHFFHNLSKYLIGICVFLLILFRFKFSDFD